MTPLKYSEAKGKLNDIWYLKPPVEQIVKYLKIKYQSLCKEWGLLCKQDILAKLVNDTATIGLSRSQINRLLRM